MQQSVMQRAGETDPMSHSEAQELGAVELYLLNDLTSDQRLRFEAHYFECPACAKAVTAGQAFIRGIRPAPEPWWRRLAFPVLAPATATLIAVLTLQNVSTIPSLRTQLTLLGAPQANTVIVAHPSEKGDLPAESVKTDSVTVEMVLPSNMASPFYRIEIEGRNRLISQVVPAPEGSRLSLHVRKQALGYGSFNVRVFKLTTPASPDPGNPEHYYFKIQ